MMYLLIGTEDIIGIIYKRVTQRLYYTTVHIIKKHFLLLNIIYTHTTLSIHIQHVHVPQDMFHLVFIYYLLPIFN